MKVKFILETEVDADFYPDIVFVDSNDDPHYVVTDSIAVTLLEAGVFKIEAYRFQEFKDGELYPLDEIPSDWVLDSITMENMDCGDYTIRKKTLIRN